MLNINAPTAPQWERDHEWDPQVHLTGNAGQIQNLQNLIDRHSTRILAHFLYSPLPETYSLELQFSDEHAAQNFLRETAK